MTARTLPVLVWALCVVMAVPTAALLAVGPGGILPDIPSDIFSGIGGVAFLVLALTFASVGAVVARRAPENRIGWIFCPHRLRTGVQLLTWQYADVDLHTRHQLPDATAVRRVNSVFGEATAGALGISLARVP